MNLRWRTAYSGETGLASDLESNDFRRIRSAFMAPFVTFMAGRNGACKRFEPTNLHEGLGNSHLGSPSVLLGIDNLGHIVQPGIDEHTDETKPPVGIIQKDKPLCAFLAVIT